jgi:thymidine kinase
MKAKTRRLGGVDCVIIDYLGLIKGSTRSENRVQEVSEITRNLKMMAKDLNIPVMCYGLRTDFMTHFFPGSKRLFEIADRLVELETDCKCGKKAVISAKFLGGKLVTEGEQIDIGGDEKYKAICYSCWEKYKLAEGLDIEYKVE